MTELAVDQTDTSCGGVSETSLFEVKRLACNSSFRGKSLEERRVEGGIKKMVCAIRQLAGSLPDETLGGVIRQYLPVTLRSAGLVAEANVLNE